MARIFEALRHSDLTRRPAVARVAEHVRAPEPQTPAMEEEIPYIEVGGPQLEASKSVLSAGPRRPVTAPATVNVETTPSTSPSELKTTPVELRRVFRVPYESCWERFAADLITFRQPEHPISRQYRTLVEGLTEGLRTARAAVLLSGSRAGVGTTTVVLNLAIAGARLGKNVAVVDAVIDRPAIAGRLGVATTPGLHEVLEGTVHLQAAVQETGQTNLKAVTAGSHSGSPWLALHSLSSLITQLRQEFDLVLLDTSDWCDRVERLAIHAGCDGVYLVSAHQQAESAEFQHLLRSVYERGIRLRGCILTQR